MRISWRDDVWRDIGGGVEITDQTDEDGRTVGLLERHACSDGRVQRGSLPFVGWPDGGKQAARWTLVHLQPLTISPSVLCRECGLHGWIRDGRWVSACP